MLSSGAYVNKMHLIESGICAVFKVDNNFVWIECQYNGFVSLTVNLSVIREYGKDTE
jgi:hypothetical protein